MSGKIGTLGICEVMRGASPRSREEASLRNRQSIRSKWYCVYLSPSRGANVSLGSCWGRCR